MANLKITEFTALTTPDNADVFVIVDVAPTPTTKKITWANMMAAVLLDVPAASETVAGIAEIATQTETNTGTDDTRIISPIKLNDWWNNFILQNNITYGGGDFSVEAGVLVIDETLGTLYTAFIDRSTAGTLEIGKNNAGTGNATTINIGVIATNVAVNIGTIGTNTITIGSSASTLYAGASLLASAASKDLGSTTKPFHELYIYGGGTFGTHYLKLTGTPTGSRTLTLPDTTDTLVGKATTDTLTNKRVTDRVVTMADATSFTMTADTADINYQANTQAVGVLTANAPSGTPTDGQSLILRIKSTNIQTFSWNAIFQGSTDVPLPTATTGSSKYDYFAFRYNSDNTKWNIMAINKGF